MIEHPALPEAVPGVRFELLDGELVTMNDPLPIHQDAAGALYAELRAWRRIHHPAAARFCRVQRVRATSQVKNTTNGTYRANTPA